MKKKQVFFLSLIMLLMCSVPCTAQINWKSRFDEKVIERVNKRLDQKLDKMIDQGLDKVEDKTEEAMTPKEASPRSDIQDKPADRGDAGLPEAFSYDWTAEYRIDTRNEKDAARAHIEYLVSRSHDFLITRTQSMTVNGKPANGSEQMKNTYVVFDFPKDRMLIVIKSQQRVMVMKMNTGAENEGGDAEVTYTPTGRTKTILGHTCHEYRMKSREAEGSVWVAKSAELDLSPLFSSLPTGGGGTPGRFKQPPVKGMMMEMDWHSTKNPNESMHAIATNISKQGGRISIKGYRVMTMPGAKF